MSIVFPVGTPVEKVGGDYAFEGEVMAAFPKKSGVIRYVVEDDRGALHIYSEKNLKLRQQQPSFKCPTCEMVSYHPKDVEHGYCGNCHQFTGDDMRRMFAEVPNAGGGESQE